MAEVCNFYNFLIQSDMFSQNSHWNEKEKKNVKEKAKKKKKDRLPEGQIELETYILWTSP